MQVLCVVDGRPFEAKRSSARYCSERCKKRAQRDPSRATPGPARGTGGPGRGTGSLARVASIAPAAGEALEAAPVGRVALLTQQTLERVGRLDTVEGAVALALAAKLDEPGMDTGSSIAAVARQLQLALDRAVAGTSAVETPLDKIRRERSLRTG